MLCTLGHQRASAGERVADPIQRNCWKHPGHSGSHSGDGCCPFHVTGTLWQFLAIFRTRAFCSPATAPWALCSHSISSQSPPIQLIFNFKTCCLCCSVPTAATVIIRVEIICTSPTPSPWTLLPNEPYLFKDYFYPILLLLQNLPWLTQSSPNPAFWN